jgi:putative FmdB family regulatory protein
MPLHDYLCLDCGASSEILVTRSDDPLECSACGSRSLEKQLSATSSMTGSARFSMPGPGDTACCGASPDHAGCAGPGSCCGKTPFTP